ncbi:MAG: SGNH/GDSL hydrolase family protein [Candidatus Aminicenantes bacterium]|nr:SGNH/GDSL hydrolase family protein [Candidatus Aminicenantes bacterium]
MDHKRKHGYKKLSLGDFFFIIMGLSIFMYFYIGFFSPDPNIGSKAKIILWAIRIGLPLFMLILLALYLGIRRRRIAPASIWLLLGSIIMTAFLVYPFVSYFYGASVINQNLDEYHPYLQIAPKDIPIPDGENTKNALRIFCLGGSTTEFPDTEGRDWSTRIQELLQNMYPEKHFEVYNLGRMWYTTLHSIINYSVNLRHHKPDILIAMHGINDLLQNADFCSYSFAPFAEDYRHFLGPVSQLVLHRSFLQSAVQVIRSIWYYKPRKVIDTDIFPGLVPFTRNLKTLCDLAKTDSIRIILLTQPHLYKESMSEEEKASFIMLKYEAVGPDIRWSTETARKGMNQYNNAVREVAKKEKVFLIDLEKSVPKNLDYFTDEVHYQDRTYDLIAGHITTRLLEEGIIK